MFPTSQMDANNLASENKRMQRMRKKEMMGSAGLQYAMKGGLNSAISGSLHTSGLKAQEKDDNLAEVIIAGKDQVEAHEDQIIQDNQEKQHMEQVSKICEMEKEYQKEAFIIPSCS